MAARAARSGNELRPARPEVPRRPAEQELRADLKTDREWPYRLGVECRVAAIEPGGLPAVWLVGQVKLGAAADVPAPARPREGLIETPRTSLDGTGRKHDLRLELR